MKKNIIALAVASAIAAPVAMADAPVVYGQINAAIDSLGGDGADGMKTTDRDSRIGVKGSADLGNGLKAVYKMEQGLKVADGFKFSGRNAYVGLAGGFGTVLVGRHDSPLKMSQPTDLFGDSTYADIGKTTMTGKLGLLGKTGENRFDNVVAYVSPSFSGVKLIAAGVSMDGGKDSSLSNAYSVALTYGSTKDGLYLAAAMDSADEDITAALNDAGLAQGGEEWTHTRFSAQYKTGGLTVNGIYQTYDDGASAKSNAEGTNTQIGVAYAMGKFTPKAKYATTDFKGDQDTGTAYGVGVDYALGKKTKAYVEYVASDDDMNGGEDENITALSVGMVHKF